MRIKEEEIKIVKNNIKIFDQKIKYEKIFLESMLRKDQHALFYILLDPIIFSLLEKAVSFIKKYKKGIYLNKMVKKIKEAKKYNDQKDKIAEIIIFGYFCEMLHKDKNIDIVWERKINTGEKNVDISIKNKHEGYYINIDVAVLHENKKIQEKQNKMPKKGYLVFFEIKEDKRILGKIINKLNGKKAQFPKGRNEFNFVWIIHTVFADDIDFQWNIEDTETGIMKNDKIVSRYSNKDGLVHIIDKNKYSLIHGVIYSKWDINSHKIIKVLKLPDKIYKIIR